MCLRSAVPSPPDTVPPPAPLGLTAQPDHATGKITLEWEPAADAVSYVLYRSTTPTAAWPGLVAQASSSQWVAVATTTHTRWVDSPGYEQDVWYVVRAQDAGCGGHSNLSAPSLAVHAILHDRPSPIDEMAGMRATYLSRRAIDSIRLGAPLPINIEDWDMYVHV